MMNWEAIYVGFGISLPRVMSAARVEEAYLIGVLRKRRKDNYDDGCGCL